MNENIKSLLRTHKTKDQQTYNFWIERYIKFIEKCQERQYELTQCQEIHHIIPRSWKEGKDYIKDNDNLIYLPIKAHIIAHHLLARTGDKSMNIAFKWVISNNKCQFNYVVTARLASEYKKSILRPVINLNSGQVFQTTLLACKSYGDQTDLLRPCVTKGRRYHGCYWQYLDLMEHTTIQQELERLNNIRISHIKSKPIVRLDTGEVYPSVKDARKQCNIKYIKAGDFKIHAGTYWIYQSDIDKDHNLDYWRDYCNQRVNEREIKKKTKKRKTTGMKVIDIDTNQVWESATQASYELGLSPTTVATMLKRNAVTIGGRRLRRLDLNA